MQSPHKKASQSGFTLIEVILAIAILGVMFTLNYQILRGIVTAKELVEDRRDAMYIANSLITRLSRELQLAVAIPRRHRLFNCPESPIGAQQQELPPPDAQSEGEGSSQFFLGASKENGSSVQFMAKGAGQQTADASGQTGVVMLKYSVVQDPERRAERNAPLMLIRSETPSSGQLLKDCAHEMRFPITANLISFNMRFFDSKMKTWIEEWDVQRSSRLPNIIEFTVSLITPKGNRVTHTSAVRVTSADG
jgi:prepilin-type N-terminal cleavage/methylation domain-containing protein